MCDCFLTLDWADKPSKASENRYADREKLGLAPIPKGQSRTPPPEPTNALQKVEVEKTKQDDALSDLSNILGDLKGMAMDMGGELDRSISFWSRSFMCKLSSSFKAFFALNFNFANPTLLQSAWTKVSATTLRCSWSYGVSCFMDATIYHRFSCPLIFIFHNFSYLCDFSQ